MDFRSLMEDWDSLNVEEQLIEAGGITALYPTRIPVRQRSRFLSRRDGFDEFARRPSLLSVGGLVYAVATGRSRRCCRIKP
jgi:hypothetical protein